MTILLSFCLKKHEIKSHGYRKEKTIQFDVEITFLTVRHFLLLKNNFLFTIILFLVKN